LLNVYKENKMTSLDYIGSLLTGFCFFPFDPGTEPRFAAEEEGWWGAVTV
jgi:hypothetical protein